MGGVGAVVGKNGGNCIWTKIKKKLKLKKEKERKKERKSYKPHQKNPLNLINECYKVKGYKVNIQINDIFMHK